MVFYWVDFGRLEFVFSAEILRARSKIASSFFIFLPQPPLVTEFFTVLSPPPLCPANLCGFELCPLIFISKFVRFWALPTFCLKNCTPLKSTSPLSQNLYSFKHRLPFFMKFVQFWESPSLFKEIFTVLSPISPLLCRNFVQIWTPLSLCLKICMLLSLVSLASRNLYGFSQEKPCIVTNLHPLEHFVIFGWPLKWCSQFKPRKYVSIWKLS